MGSYYYGQDNNACIAGTWTQVVNSVQKVDARYIDEYSKYKEKKLEEEKLKAAINPINVQGFAKDATNELVDYVKKPGREKLQETLASGLSINFDKPEDITIEQQKVLAEINKKFAKIKEYLPNYNKPFPTNTEYQTIINSIFNQDNTVLINFSEEYSKTNKTKLEEEGKETANKSTHIERVKAMKRKAFEARKKVEKEI
ncbi:MAG: hypothetical protein RCG15_03580 [Candidatus Rickettsia vulgarisii]